MGINIELSSHEDLSSINNLLNSHRDESFTYSADIQLFKLFSKLDSCRIFLAKAANEIVGCIYGMRYMYDCGWIGGLLVHREFRRRGVGRKLLEKALGFLRTLYTFTFVDPENTPARKLFESVGFNTTYRRLNYKVQPAATNTFECCDSVIYEVKWDELIGAIGFKERRGVVTLGYYPVKLTEDVFDDLKRRRSILEYGGIIAIIENSHSIRSNEHTFIFNNHIIKEVTIPPEKSVIEINPFYVKPETIELTELLRHLVTHGEAIVWTYEGDPSVSRLPWRGYSGPLVMELCKLNHAGAKIRGSSHL